MINKAVILLLITLSSCAYLDYGALPGLAKSIVVGPDDIIVDSDFYQAQPYSFIKVTIGKRAIAIFTLAHIQDGRYEWVSKSGHKLITLSNGQIVKSIADNFSFSLIPISSHANVFSSGQTMQYFIQLEDPRAMFSQTGVTQPNIQQNLQYLDSIISLLCLNEEVESNSANWNYKNNYCYDAQSGMPIQTIQHFNPLYKPIELTFYYKY